MKKIICLFMSIVVIISIFVACSKNDTNISENITTTTTSTTTATETTTEVETTLKTLKIGDKITTNDFVLSFDEVMLKSSFEYSTGGNSSMIPYVEDGYKLLIIKGHCENLSDSVLSSDTSFVNKVIVDDKFTADSYNVRMQFKRDKYFELDPYTEKDVFFFVNVPNKIAEEFKSAKLVIEYDNETFEFESGLSN